MPEPSERWRWDEGPTPAQKQGLDRAMQETLFERPWPVLPTPRAAIEALRTVASAPSPVLPPDRHISGSPYDWDDVIRDAQEIAVAHGIDPAAFWRLNYFEVRLAVRTRAAAEAGRLFMGAALTAWTEGDSPVGDVRPPSLSDLRQFINSDGVRDATRQEQRRACREHFAPQPVRNLQFREAIQGQKRRSGRRKKS